MGQLGCQSAGNKGEVQGTKLGASLAEALGSVRFYRFWEKVALEKSIFFKIKQLE